ncbi:mechanosensitive ion channel family protein [Halovivax sp.]|uniref:mechanosensitive ion channel family protein n=1 Tax=Halovivax sp. TaxID=1935978 RepID=UPI0025BB46A5|nr:mechanosensitive ion channel family protein [Halovivax sp.]
MSGQPPFGDGRFAGGLPVVDGFLPSRLEAAIAEPLVHVPLILIGSYFLARFVQWWGTRRLVEEGELVSFRRALLEETYQPLAITIALVGVYASLDVLDLADGSAILVPTITTVLILVWMRTAVRLGNRWIENVKASDNDYEFAPVFKNFWTVAVVLGGALLLLSVWNVEITPFLASAGILGIILGFAAQDGISNLIGGVALYFDNTYKIGDVILVEDGMRGTVTDIGVRSTTVLTTDNRLVSVPNSVLNSTQVVNETAPQRHVRIEIPITVAYGTDYREVERILLEICADAPLIRESPAPRVLFSDFGGSALEFTIRAYISHPLTEKRARDQVNRRIDDAFAEAEITIPFPQRTLSYLEDADEVRFEEDRELEGASTGTPEPSDQRD